MLQTYVRIHSGVEEPERKGWREQRRWRKMNQNILYENKVRMILRKIHCTIMINKWFIGI